jgi:hypothetical protein
MNARMNIHFSTCAFDIRNRSSLPRFFILIATGSFSAILFSWHGCFMFLEVKLEKKLKANLLAPFSIFLPDLFTKKGNYHRIKFLWYMGYKFIKTCFHWMHKSCC